MDSTPAVGDGLAELVMRHSPCAVAVLAGQELRLRALNPAFTAATGVGEHSVGARLIDVLPGCPVALLRRILRVQRTGNPEALRDLRMPAADGSERDWDIRLVAAKDPSAHGGRSVLVVCQEVTEHVRLREALTESEERLRLAANGAPITLLNRDRDLRVVWANNPTWSVTPKSVIGTVPEDLYEDADAQRLRELYRPVLEQGQTARRRLLLRRRDGDEADWFEIHVQPLRDELGEIVGLRTAAYDVSAHVQTEAALVQREAQLELALEEAEMGEWELDLVRGSVRYSRSTARLYGIHDTGYPLPVERFLERIHPDDIASFRRSFQRAMDHGGSSVRTEFRVMGPEGEERWLATRAHIVRDAGGDPSRLLGVDIDISEQKREVARLEQANQELEQFAYWVAHDLREPIRSVGCFASLLERQLGGEAAFRQPLSFIRQGIDRMTELVGDLLGYARAGSSNLPREIVDMNAIVQEALVGLHTAIAESGAAVSVGPLPKIEGNPPLLRQALQNIIGNALKFRRPEVPPQVRISAHRERNDWVIAVADNGVGIDPLHRARLFRPFQRVPDASALPGAGLGLVLCRRVIEQHGGRFWVASEPGEGSVFHVALPADARQLNAAK